MLEERRVDDKSFIESELAKQEILKNTDRKTVGVCFSAGGYRTAFHAGFIDGLKKLGVEIDQYVGVSSGALSAFYASLGLPGKEWHDEVLPFWHLTMLRPKQVEASINAAVSKLLNLRRESDVPVKKIRYELLNTKLRIIATTLPNLKPKIFSSFADKEDVIRKITASCTVPYWTKFPSRKVDNSRYVNGFFATLLPYELPTKFLATDIKISLRILPPYFDLDIPNINLREFAPKKYKYNIIQSIVPLTWMMRQLYQDGYGQALQSGIDKDAGLTPKSGKSSYGPGQNTDVRVHDHCEQPAGDNGNRDSQGAASPGGLIRRLMIRNSKVFE